MEKMAKDLTVGDHIRLDSGEFTRVSELSRGFVRYEKDNSIMINHGNGFSQVPSRMMVTVKDEPCA